MAFAFPHALIEHPMATIRVHVIVGHVGKGPKMWQSFCALQKLLFAQIVTGRLSCWVFFSSDSVFFSGQSVGPVEKENKGKIKENTDN